MRIHNAPNIFCMNYKQLKCIIDLVLNFVYLCVCVCGWVCWGHCYYTVLIIFLSHLNLRHQNCREAIKDVEI